MVQTILHLSRPQTSLVMSVGWGITALVTQRKFAWIVSAAFLGLAAYFSSQKPTFTRAVTVVTRPAANFNKALDELFVEIHERVGNDMGRFQTTYDKLLRSFVTRVRPLGKLEQKKFQNEFNKFKLIKELLAKPRASNKEGELFTRISKLQKAIQKIGSESAFRSCAQELRLLVQEANRSTLVFSSLIDSKLEGIRQTLMKTSFYKKPIAITAPSKKEVPSPKTYATAILPHPEKTDGVIDRSTPYWEVRCGEGNDPIFTDDNKKRLQTHLTGGTCRPRGPMCFYKMRIDKKKAANLKLQKKVEVNFIKGPMSHRPSVLGKFKVWVSNFADKNLFFGAMGGLFAQDEIQTAEHPGMQNLRRTIVDLGEIDSKPVCILQDDEVAVVEDVERRARFNSFKGIYGQDFQFAEWPLIEGQCTKITTTKSNIIAFRAPDMGSSKKGLLYTREDLSRFLYRALAASLAIKANTPPKEKAIWETGLAGTGAFGNSIAVSVILQFAAANFAGVDVVDFFPFNHGDAVKAAFNQYKQIEAANLGKSPEALLDYLFANRERLNLRYGASDGN
ncbi:MAG TPA: hypothetical protein VLG44_01815 [Chlamydiales bacterium]|nr:hypothetical protein [Chlamydiales bacterium]